MAGPRPAPASLRAELLRRSAWLALGSALGRLLPLAVLLLAGRQFSASGFASASAAFAWAGVAMSLTSAGLATVTAQRLAASADTARQAALAGQALRRSLAASALLAAVAAAAGGRGLPALFSQHVDGRIALPAALAGALWSQVALVVACLNGSHRARAASATLASCGALQGGAMALALWTFHDPLALAWGLVLGSAAAAAVAAGTLQQVFGAALWRSAAAPAGPAVPWRHSPVLWHSIAAASVLPVGFLASALVGRGPQGGQQLALYFALEQLHQLAVYLPAVMGQALLPLVSRRLHGPAAADHGALVRRLVGAALAGALLGLLGAALLTADVGWLWALLHRQPSQPGDDWALRWMVASASLGFGLSALGGTMLGRGQIMRAGQLNLGWGLLFLGGTALLAHRGTEGLQLARLLASLVLIALTATLLLRPVPAAAPVEGLPR